MKVNNTDMHASTGLPLQNKELSHWKCYVSYVFWNQISLNKFKFLLLLSDVCFLCRNISVSMCLSFPFFSPYFWFLILRSWSTSSAFHNFNRKLSLPNTFIFYSPIHSVAYVSRGKFQYWSRSTQAHLLVLGFLRVLRFAPPPSVTFKIKCYLKLYNSWHSASHKVVVTVLM